MTFTPFLIYWDSSSSRLLKHSWAFDALGRRGDITVDLPSDTNLTMIDLTYNTKGHLSGEELVGGNWDMGYSIDSAGNRTARNDGTTTWTHGYGAGNREASVGQWPGTAPAALAYDYKGNVTDRETLDGTAEFEYQWDAYDRLTTATQTSGPMIAYTYDAGGRLLRRTADPATSSTLTQLYYCILGTFT